MSFPRYARYKESGVAWLGEVPEEWKLRGLRHLATIRNGTDFKHLEVQEGGFPVYGSGGEFARVSQFLSNKPSVLLGRKGTVDKPLFVDEPFWTVDTMYYTEVASDTNPKYLYYFCTLIPFDFFQYGTALPSMTQSALYGITVPLPSELEQLGITGFLDRETGKIDALVEEQRRLIKLLKEKRQAVISQAVTKGLNPNAPMKDSGVEWLGKVPEHWTLLAVRYRYEVALGKMLDEKKITGGHLRPYLRNIDVQWNRVNLSDLPEMDFQQDDKLRYALRRGDLLVCEGGELGRSAVLNDDPTEVYYQKALHRLRPYSTKCDLPKFMLYLFWNAASQGRFIASQNKATIGHLPAEALRAYRFAFPSRTEQNEVVEYLDSFTRDCEYLMEKARSIITLLQERRSALISAAVTGKIDVRGSADKSSQGHLSSIETSYTVQVS